MRPPSLLLRVGPTALDPQPLPSSGKVQAVLHDLGIALGGLSSPAYCAFAWRWARDDLAYRRLRWVLLIEADRVAKRERWPDRMRGRRYLDPLVMLALREEHEWFQMRARNAHAQLAGFDQDLWDHRLSRYYEGVRDILERWCGEAFSHIARMQIDEDELSRACG